MDSMRPLARLAKVMSIAVLFAATACQPANDPNNASNAAHLTPATPAFVEMQKADILRSAMGCLQSPPYPMDGGPICLRTDGSWISYSGWGQYAGRFRITGNRVFLDGPADTVIQGKTTSVAFFRDREGAMFINDDPLDGHRPLRRIAPYPEAEYLRNFSLK